MSVAHPHHDQIVLTTVETAELFGRSTSWVRNQINTGRLRTLHPCGIRPFLVTEASAQILKARLDERQKGAAKPYLRIVRGEQAAPQLAEAGKANRPHWLEFIIDNTGRR